jgi:DNA ligase (NAD+)
MEWSASRTGLINPVAIFAPVELEGTTVSRASVHNISIVRNLKLGLGDRITVYKANMIIPQIAENLTRSDTLEIPAVCPVCGQPTQIRQVNDVQSLYCNNPDCDAKKIKAFTLFVSRDALNVDGLSESTLEKFLARGFLHEFADLFKLDRYKQEITQMEGFGEKSYSNLMESIEKARDTTLARVIYGLGIENVGVANAKILCRHFQYSLEALQQATVEDLNEVDGVGGVIAAGIHEFFHREEKLEQLDHLMRELRLAEETVEEGSQTLAGMSFVITGSLEHYENRNALKAEIENRGGKVTGSVTGKTVCLINNDTTSQSSKNKKAKELGVRIVSEETFMEEYLQEN